uniref:Helitron_like_N domain-containing protein n=1 Tax=Ascaris lumbricoides TaxID=6252 RepID=A0A0M3HY98_ASCLU
MQKSLTRILNDYGDTLVLLMQEALYLNGSKEPMLRARPTCAEYKEMSGQGTRTPAFSRHLTEIMRYFHNHAVSMTPTLAPRSTADKTCC